MRDDNANQSLGHGAELDPEVADYLSTIRWRPDEYPMALLELNDQERHYLELCRTRTYREVALAEGVSATTVRGKCVAALGKEEVLEALQTGQDIFSLDQNARRVVILNQLFGPHWSRYGVQAVQVPEELVLQRARVLDERLGSKWRHTPQLCTLPAEKLDERIALYDALLGPNWRNTPTILTLDVEVTRDRIEKYDQWFGSSWRSFPTILTNKPETVRNSARALRLALDITLENTPIGAYFQLLSTSVANKRRKAAAIRRDILGHTQVYTFERPTPLAIVVAARRGQTPDQRARELEEIEEFKAFIHTLGARVLIASMGEIKRQATVHHLWVAGDAPASPDH